MQAISRYVRRSISSWAILVFMVICLAYFGIPLLWLVISSTKDSTALFTTFGLFFDKSFNLAENVKAVFTIQNGVFTKWMWNTMMYAVGASLGSAIVSALAGYAFSQFRFAGRDGLFAIVLASVFIPGTVFAVPLFFLISKTGLSGTLWAVILPALTNPFGVYLMRLYADQSVPQDIIDSARVDGAEEWRIFVQIALPLLLPGFVTVLLFAFVGAWNNYFLPLLVLTRPEVYTITVGLDAWNAVVQGQNGTLLVYPVLITASIIGTLPIMIAFIFLQRYWKGGLATGSIK